MKIQSKSLAGKKKTRTNIRTYRELRERFDSFQTLQFVFGNRQPLQIRAQLQTLTDTSPIQINTRKHLSMSNGTNTEKKEDDDDEK